MKLSVCIPMYNESVIIADTARTLYTFLEETFPGDYELIFSDDGSTDGSAECVRALSLPTVRVVGYAQNRGKGCAVRTAMLAAEGEMILFTDADLAYGTDAIGQIATFLDEHPGAEGAVGSRNLSAAGYEGYPLPRKIASKLYIRVLRLVAGLRISDSQCGIKLFRRETAKAIFSRCTVDGFAFDLEAILWAQKLGKPLAEFPVKIVNHRASKIRLLRDTFRMLRDAVRIKRRVARQYRLERGKSER